MLSIDYLLLTSEILSLLTAYVKMETPFYQAEDLIIGKYNSFLNFTEVFRQILTNNFKKRTKNILFLQAILSNL